MTVPLTLLGAHTVSPGSSAHEGAADARAGLAWQREMERAQRANWFQPPTSPSAEMLVDDQSETEPKTELRPVQVDSAPSWWLSADRLPGAPRLAVPMTAFLPAGHSASHTLETVAGARSADTHGAPRTDAWVSMQRALSAALDARSSGAPAASVSASAIPAPLLRTMADGHGISIHVEPSLRGAHVWIGAPVDTEIGAGALDALVRSLRRQLREGGMVLETLTVNGRAVWRAPEYPTHQSPTEETFHAY